MFEPDGDILLICGPAAELDNIFQLARQPDRHLMPGEETRPSPLASDLPPTG